VLLLDLGQVQKEESFLLSDFAGRVIQPYAHSTRLSGRGHRPGSHEVSEVGEWLTTVRELLHIIVMLAPTYIGIHWNMGYHRY
jgi:hypothetical protein